MNFEKYLGSLVPALADLKLDPSAKPFYDIMSGGLIWSDEKLPLGLSAEQLGCLRAVFRFRTSLIEGTPDSRFQTLWNVLKERCPGWIGFAPSRCSPTLELRETLHKLRGR